MGNLGLRSSLRLADDPGKPGSYCGLHCLEVRLQAVVAGHLHHGATRGGWRNAERIPRTLHDQRRDGHLVELVQTALCRGARRSARGLKREGEAKDTDGAGHLRGAAGNTCAHGPAADDERQPSQLAREQVDDHRPPGGVELARRSGRAAPGDAVGLLDERDADPHRASDPRHGHQVSRGHPSSGSVTEDKRGS